MSTRRQFLKTVAAAPVAAAVGVPLLEAAATEFGHVGYAMGYAVLKTEGQPCAYDQELITLASSRQQELKALRASMRDIRQRFYADVLNGTLKGEEA